MWRIPCVFMTTIWQTFPLFRMLARWCVSPSTWRQWPEQVGWFWHVSSATINGADDKSICIWYFGDNQTSSCSHNECQNHFKFPIRQIHIMAYRIFDLHAGKKIRESNLRLPSIFNRTPSSYKLYTTVTLCTYTHAAPLLLLEVTISSALEPNLPQGEYNEEACVPQHQPQPARVHRNKRRIRSLCKRLTRMITYGLLHQADRTRFRCIWCSVPAST